MVSGLSIAAICFSMLAPLAVLIVFLVYFLRHYKTGMKPVLIGAGVFIVFAMILERLLHYFILVANGTTAEFFKNVLAYSIYAGLAAGIFEETGRLVGFKLFFKKMHEWKYGVAYGIGHGGIELILIGVLTQINYLVYSVMINNGSFSQILKMLSKMPEQAAAYETIEKQLISSPSWEFLMSGIERIDAFLLHLGLSVLVLYAVANRRYIFYVLAIIVHAIVDFTAVFCAANGVNTLIIEGFITLVAIASVVFVIHSRKMFGSNENIVTGTPKEAEVTEK